MKKYWVIFIVCVLVTVPMGYLIFYINSELNEANKRMAEYQKDMKERKNKLDSMVVALQAQGIKIDTTWKDLSGTGYTYKGQYQKCLQVQKWADDMVRFMDNLKFELIKISEGPNSEAIEGGKINMAKLNKKDDYDTPTTFMVGDSNKKGKAYLLHTKFRQYNNALLSIMEPKDTLAYTDSLRSEIDYRNYADQEDPDDDCWEKHIFYHTPMAAAIAHLSKLQGDVRSDESIVIDYLFNKTRK